MTWSGGAIALAAIPWAAAFVGGACAPDAGQEVDVRIACTLQPQPPVVGPATAAIELKDASGAPLQGATLSVEGNMNHAGMVPSFATVRETGDGRYEAKLQLTMPGDWFLLVEGKLTDGRPFTRTIPIPAVRRP